MSSERALVPAPVLEGDITRAEALLARYGFHRVETDAAAWVAYFAASGPFALRVRLSQRDAVRSTVALGIAEHDQDGFLAAQFHPWRVELPNDPLAVAAEAAWFLATVAGLTPPVVGGKLITERE